MPLMVLSIDKICAVAGKHRRGRSRRIFKCFVFMSKNELASLKRSPSGNRRRISAGRLSPANHQGWIGPSSLEESIADAVSISKMLFASWFAVFVNQRCFLIIQVVTLIVTMPGKKFHAIRLLLFLICVPHGIQDSLVALFYCFKRLAVDQDHDMDCLIIKGTLPDRIPVNAAARPRVAENVTPGSHAHRKLIGKAVQRVHRNSQGSESLVCKRNVCRRIRNCSLPRRGGRDQRRHQQYKPPSRIALVHTKTHIPALEHAESGIHLDHAALNVVQIQ